VNARRAVHAAGNLGLGAVPSLGKTLWAGDTKAGQFL
jgi:hypothetical protein